MSYRKVADYAVKVGEYQKDGETKGRYENVGMEMADGQNVIMLVKRTFNPAGVPNPDGKDMVMLSRFAVREQETPKGKPAARPDFEPDQEIPF
jgi:hypothetical protein